LDAEINLPVNLADEEQKQLLKITKTPKTSREILHVNILLSTVDNRLTKLTVKEIAQKTTPQLSAYKKYVKPAPPTA